MLARWQIKPNNFNKSTWNRYGVIYILQYLFNPCNIWCEVMCFFTTTIPLLITHVNTHYNIYTLFIHAILFLFWYDTRHNRNCSPYSVRVPIVLKFHLQYSLIIIMIDYVYSNRDDAIYLINQVRWWTFLSVYDCLNHIEQINVLFDLYFSLFCDDYTHIKLFSNWKS